MALVIRITTRTTTSSIMEKPRLGLCLPRLYLPKFFIFFS